jgi:hypothetical protein
MGAEYAVEFLTQLLVSKMFSSCVHYKDFFHGHAFTNKSTKKCTTEKNVLSTPDTMARTEVLQKAYSLISP